MEKPLKRWSPNMSKRSTAWLITTPATNTTPSICLRRSSCGSTASCRFDEDSRFSTWLYRVTSNVCKDYVRKKNGKNDLSLYQEGEDGEYSFDVPDLRYNTENALNSRRCGGRSRSLQSLSPTHREILVMRDVLGLTYEDIAQTLQLEEGTVKSRIFQGPGQVALEVDGKRELFWPPSV